MDSPPLASDQPGFNGVRTIAGRVTTGLGQQFGSEPLLGIGSPGENTPIFVGLSEGTRAGLVVTSVIFVASKAQTVGVALIDPAGGVHPIWSGEQGAGVAVGNTFAGPTFYVPQGWRAEYQSTGGAKWKNAAIL